jgi:hypothetical protein
VVYTCNNGGRYRYEDHFLRMALGKDMRPYLKNKLKQKGLGCGTSGRALA